MTFPNQEIETKKEEITHWKAGAKKYDSIWGSSSASGIFRIQRRSKILIEKTGMYGKNFILEVGCGTGEYTKEFIKSGYNIIATDISRDMINKAQKKNINNNAEYVICDIEKMPFKSKSFDAVVGNSVLHHLYDINSALSEIKRIMVNGASYSFLEPNARNPVNFFIKNFSKYKKLADDSPNEKAFTVKKIKNTFESNGFKVYNAYCIDFIPPGFSISMLKIFTNLDSFLSKIPIINQLAASILIYGRT